jgi:hypothetical protein
MIERPDEAAAMGLRGRAAVLERYHADAMAEETERVLARVAANQGQLALAQ